MDATGIALWRQVADALRRGIQEGRHAGLLPSEAELSARLGVNRHTLRRAISALAEEGLLRTERGRGTFVTARAPRIRYPIGPRTRFSETMLNQSLELSGRLIRAARVAADAETAARLGCPVGAALHRLESLRVVEGAPLSRSVSLFPAERFPGIVVAYAECGTITGALAREGLADYRRAETRITAERADAADAEWLGCAPDAVIIVSAALDTDLEGRPVQVIGTRFLADRVELVLTGHPAA